MDHIEVSDLFASVQGEGPRVGTPSIFLRTRRCTLRCSWCDTKYAVFPDDPGWADFKTYNTDELFDAIKNMAAVGLAADDIKAWNKATTNSALPLPLLVSGRNIRHLVITGGEPLIWSRQLAPLIVRLIDEKVIGTIEVETSGTISPEYFAGSLASLRHLTSWPFDTIHFNVSPKLSSSQNGVAGVHPEHFQLFARLFGGATFKIVVRPIEDDLALALLLSVLNEYRHRHADIILMPEGATVADQIRHLPYIRRLAKRYGVGVTERHHIYAWGDKRGK